MEIIQEMNKSELLPKSTGRPLCHLRFSEGKYSVMQNSNNHVWHFVSGSKERLSEGHRKRKVTFDTATKHKHRKSNTANIADYQDSTSTQHHSRHVSFAEDKIADPTSDFEQLQAEVTELRRQQAADRARFQEQLDTHEHQLEKLQNGMGSRRRRPSKTSASAMEEEDAGLGNGEGNPE